MKFLLSFLLLITTSAAHAQQSPWQGEWGGLDNSASRITISACSGTICTFEIKTDNGNGMSCSTGEPQPLRMLSATEATAQLTGDSAHPCDLQLTRNDASGKATIAVKQSGTCGYYCNNPTLSFNAALTQRSATPYAGPHAADCVSHPSPAMMATCTAQDLGKLEQQWQELYVEYPLTLTIAKDDSPGYTHMTLVDEAVLKQCDSAANPAQCLHDRFTADIALMQSKKSATESSSTERGDPTTGHALALKIAGRYRHSFANGDVQGDHYRSTDTLTITPVGPASIHFDIGLNFYNGHTCSLSGGALFRKDGTFVFDDDPANAIPPEPACRLAIIPSSNGVSFKDLNGSCQDYCGARGSWDGASFTFAQRVPAKK
jgi:hypothetical protein